MEQKSIKKNIIMNSILFVSNSIFPIISYSYASRILLPSGIGKVSFVDSIFAYFILLSGLGIPAYGRREVAKVRDNKKELSQLMHELMLIILVTTLVSYLLLFLSIEFIPKLNQYKLLFIIMGIEIFLSRTGVEWFYQGLEEYSYITIRSIIFKCISLVLLFTFVKSEQDIYIYAFIHVFTINASNICNLINIRKYIDFKRAENYDFIRHCKPVIVLFAASLAITVYGHCDITMLGFISSDYEVGLYNTALKIKSIVIAASTALTSVLVPRIAFFFSNKNEKGIIDILSFSIKTSLLVSIPLCIFCIFFGKSIINGLSGEEYLSASNTLHILMFCSVAQIVTYLCGAQILIPMGLEKCYSQSVTIGLFINILLNSVLIPTYGAWGAALGTLITEIWNVIWMANGCKKVLKDVLPNVRFIQYILPLIVSSVLSLWLKPLLTNNMNDRYAVILLATVFWGSYYLILLVLKESVLWSFIKRKPLV